LVLGLVVGTAASVVGSIMFQRNQARGRVLVHSASGRARERACSGRPRTREPRACPGSRSRRGRDPVIRPVLHVGRGLSVRLVAQRYQVSTPCRPPRGGLDLRPGAAAPRPSPTSLGWSGCPMWKKLARKLHLSIGRDMVSAWGSCGAGSKFRPIPAGAVRAESWRVELRTRCWGSGGSPWSKVAPNLLVSAGRE
jgi:hypothetical protein